MTLARKACTNLSRALAVLHDLDFAVPSFVGLAAKKIYAHRIRITTPRSERSMQYGSELGAVTKLLENFEPEQVIQEVLQLAEVPL